MIVWVELALFEISEEQLIELETQRTATFVDRAVSFVIENVPEAEQYERRGLQQALLKLREAGAPFGLVSERTLVVLLAASVKLQQNVLKEPALYDILRDIERSEAVRVAYVDGWCFK